jgi:hypothetical protein
MRPLLTDEQFERAYLAGASVYVKDKQGMLPDTVGALEAFNPLFVTVAGEWLPRDGFEFRIRD